MSFGEASSLAKPVLYATCYGLNLRQCAPSPYSYRPVLMHAAIIVQEESVRLLHSLLPD